MYKIFLVATVLLLMTTTAYSNSPTIVAKVNGEPIYEKELTESMDLRFNKSRKFGVASIDQQKPEIAYALKMQTLSELINSKVLYQASQSEKFSKEKLAKIKENVDQKLLSLAHTFGSEKSYEKFLATKDSSLKEKRDFFRGTFLVQAYFDKQGLTNPNIPEADIKALYETQKTSFKIPEQVKLSQIFIPVEKGIAPKEKEVIEKKAEEARQLLFDGKSFSNVAEIMTEKTKLEVTGGERGFIKRGTLPKEVDNIAFTIMPNIVSHVIKSNFGYHVLMITDKKPSTFSPYNKVRDFLLKYLENEAVSHSVTEHTKMLKEKASIEIFLKE